MVEGPLKLPKQPPTRISIGYETIDTKDANLHNILSTFQFAGMFVVFIVVCWGVVLRGLSSKNGRRNLGNTNAGLSTGKVLSKKNNTINIICGVMEQISDIT